MQLIHFMGRIIFFYHYFYTKLFLKFNYTKRGKVIQLLNCNRGWNYQQCGDRPSAHLCFMRKKCLKLNSPFWALISAYLSRSTNECNVSFSELKTADTLFRLRFGAF